MAFAMSDTDMERRGSMEKALVIKTEDVAHPAAPTTTRPQHHGHSPSLLARAQRLVASFGVEQRGIERVPADERTDTSVTKLGTLWLSANMTVATFALGALALPVFELGFVDAALTIISVNILGILPVCFFSTLGPRFGLRQMVLSRFYFGYYGVKLVAIFNILACLGWSAVNVIVGAQLLAAINPGPKGLPGWAGILIIALSTLLITTFGYRLVHAYERWSWAPVLAIFCIVAAEFGSLASFDPSSFLSGPEEAGAVLSFAASVYGFSTGWTSMAADYAVYQPESRSRRAVFAWTFAGLVLPLVFTELLGAAVMTASAADPYYAAAYTSEQVGGVLAHVLVTTLGGFGRVCLALLALSIVANNCPNIYSVSLSLQVLARRTQRVPRFVWPAAATAAYVAVAVPGYGRFEAVLENLILLIAYWLAAYEGVALAEHFAFRRGPAGYAVDDYATPARLPPGYAALCAFLMGAIGAVLGMAQLWYTGPIGRLCGLPGVGGDVGFELAFAFSAVTYLALRPVERAWYGR